MQYPKITPIVAICALSCACSGSAQSVPGDTDDPGPDTMLEPGNPVETQVPPEQQQQLDALSQQLASVENLSSDGFLERYAVPFGEGPSYDPKEAAGMDLIQASAISLNASELAVLADRGFVVSDNRSFPTFTYAYQAVYQQDLPVYVSADSILWSIHKSYDAILKTIELTTLRQNLLEMLGIMRGALTAGAGSELGDRARADADVYLTVAQSLLTGEQLDPAANGSPSEIGALFNGATKADGWKSMQLFGVARDVDFSQFTPRGHYKDNYILEQYFRAMIWLGRIDFRILETQPDHSQVFHRRQLEGALMLEALMNDQARSLWQQVDTTIGGFVGEPDNMTLPELDSLLADVGVSDFAELDAVSDEDLAQAVIDGGYGTQRISSHIMINGLGSGTMPLSSVFLLFGQRYVVDSHVFSNVVYDRVQGGSVERMMPNPLDVGFAALANDQSGLLLAPELEQYGYAPDLASMRILVDAHPESYWQENLYNLWLGSLRTLGPNAAEVADPASAGMPSVTGTEAWGRRMLNTQLASWAELRHDTVLYVKQSYTGGESCEYPDAYVDPYPAFYRAVQAYAERGKAITMPLQPDTGAYFDHLSEVAGILAEMAEDQRTGMAHSPEHIEFINDAVVVEEICGGATAMGWYPGLFYGYDETEYDPTIADVHTQPTDAGGSPVGRILHVGTKMPRMMVVTVESCNGPHAYAGPVSSYYEVVTENFDRLDDARWESMQPPEDPAWLRDIVVR